MNRLLLLPALLGLGLFPASAAFIAVTTAIPLGNPGSNLSTLSPQADFFRYQQNSQNPCVIGGSDCKAEALLDKTLIQANQAEYKDVFSPFYTVNQILAVTGNLTSFGLGLDLNDTNKDQHLVQVGMYIYAAGLDLVPTKIAAITNQSWIGDAAIQAKSNGSGYSDVNFFGFDLTGLAGTQRVAFFLNMPKFANGTDGVEDGAEGLFIITSKVIIPPNEVPEPATYALIGGALVGLQLLRRRR